MDANARSDEDLSDIQSHLSALCFNSDEVSDSDFSLTSSENSKESKSFSFHRYTKLDGDVEKSSDDENVSIAPLTDESLYGSVTSIPNLELTPSLQDDVSTARTYLVTGNRVLKSSDDKECAFENWLAAKRERMRREAQKKKREMEEEQQRAEERKRLNEQRVKEWEATKSRTLMKALIKPSKETIVQPSKSVISTEEAKANYEEWCKRKDAEIKKKRQLQKAEAKKRQREIEERKRKSEEVMNKWLKEAPSKPKPVPLNQGFMTLRGTINEHFINPNEWVHPNEESKN